MNWEGITPDLYEKARKLVNWEGNIPGGAVFHVAAFNNNVLRVTDIWESADDLNKFIQSRLMPAVAQLGIKSEPKVETFPVHAIFAPALQRLT